MIYDPTSVQSSTVCNDKSLDIFSFFNTVGRKEEWRANGMQERREL